MRRGIEISLLYQFEPHRNIESIRNHLGHENTYVSYLSMWFKTLLVNSLK